MNFTRRVLGKIALASLPLAKGRAEINSNFGGVQIGAITYSFRGTNDLDAIIQAMVKIGLGEVELMSGDAKRAAGAPSQQRLAVRPGVLEPQIRHGLQAHRAARELPVHP